MLPVFIRLAARSVTVLPPPPTLLLGRMLPVFHAVGARSSTVLPPPTLLLGQMLPVSFLYGWLRDPSLCYPPPLTLLLGWMLPVFYTVGARSFTVLPPPTLPLEQMLLVSF